MRNFALGLLLFSLATPALSASGVDDIVERVVEAAGGAKRLKAVQTRHFSGTGSFNGGAASGSLEFYAKRPNLLRINFDFGGFAVSQGFDGSVAWQLQPVAIGGSGQAEEVEGDTADSIRQSADFDTPLLDYRKRGNQVELVGKEMVGNREAYRLRVIPKETKPFDILVDTGTYLVVKRIAKRNIPSLGEVTVELLLEDYRDVEGMMIPHRFVTLADGNEINVLKFSTVELNVKLDDELFRQSSVH